MNAKLRFFYFSVLFTSLLLVSCTLGRLLVPSSKPTPPVTPIPALTRTPTSPPNKFVCSVTLMGDMLKIELGVVGETGTPTDNISQIVHSQFTKYGTEYASTVELKGDLTYSKSKHTYKIEGQADVNPISRTFTYTITATGGIFGDNPQTCAGP